MKKRMLERVRNLFRPPATCRSGAVRIVDTRMGDRLERGVVGTERFSCRLRRT